MSPSSVSAESAPLRSSEFWPLGLFHACTRSSCSASRCSSTCRTAAVWCGAAGPMPSGAGWVGWRVWSAADGDPGSCKSIVSAHSGQRRAHRPRGPARLTCSDDAGARHLGCCSSGVVGRWCRGGVRVARRRSSGEAQTGPGAAARWGFAAAAMENERGRNGVRGSVKEGQGRRGAGRTTVAPV